jgi:hypothetical protein
MNSVFHRILQWSAVVLLAVVLPVAPLLYPSVFLGLMKHSDAK